MSREVIALPRRRGVRRVVITFSLSPDALDHLAETLGGDAELGGQVIRSLDAGAHGYYVARSVDQLAGVIDHALGSDTPSAHQPFELPTPQEDELASLLDRLIHAESAMAPGPTPTRKRPE